MSLEIPFASIILPVYNGENTLAATMESLLKQTYSKFELLIGIDGTTDNSKIIAQSFKDPRIKIIENPRNLGLANNLNKLISLISPQSEFIAMAEQDDVYVPERLQWQVEVMLQHPQVGLVSGIAEFVDSKRKTLFPGILVYGKQFLQQVELFKYLYVNQLKVVNTCMMIRKAVHTNNNLAFNNTYGNFNVDWDYVLRLSLVSQVYGIPKVLVHINRQVDRTSVTTNKWGQFKASRKLIKDFKIHFPVLITQKEYRAALKICRKTELGYRNKWGILVFSIYYSLLYLDFDFFRYLISKAKRKPKK
ncbi:glycosyltransferase family 2 protein [Aestuariivivens sp. NBU2969]|uniref:glycosyltransferase family 2 protein n=1 Tax=Aestuariivivens sp. NBU2969 TaxID=2873267 RepID=UPI001CBA9475|nr:glycosyltransferase [Aestuariivivens sp. NBU2969]